MIIYIHGFGSHGNSSKAKVFRKYFNVLGESFIAPSLSYVPTLAMQTLTELIKLSCDNDICLIGSSLGGFYSTYLSQLKEVKKVILINPSVTPTQTLLRAFGYSRNFYDDSRYEWNQKHIDMLKTYALKDIKNKDKFLVFLQKGDELLDYKEAVKRYKGCKLIVEDNGSHRFDGIERYLEKIRDFLLYEPILN